jgi:hypothetical protein
MLQRVFVARSKRVKMAKIHSHEVVRSRVIPTLLYSKSTRNEPVELPKHKKMPKEKSSFKLSNYFNYISRKARGGKCARMVFGEVF